MIRLFLRWYLAPVSVASWRRSADSRRNRRRQWNKTSMKMYVWGDHHSFLVVALATSVVCWKRALREIRTTDESCVNRGRVSDGSGRTNDMGW